MVTADGGTTTTPSGLARRLASLATVTDGGHPDRAGDALLVVDRGAQLLGDLDRRAEPAGRAADVEERLVQREHLDQRGDPAEVLHHRRATPSSKVSKSGATTTACGAHPAGPGHRHRRVDAVPRAPA